MPAGSMDRGAAADVDKIVPPEAVFGKIAAVSMDEDVAATVGRRAVVGRMAEGVVTILAAEPRLPPPPAVNSVGLSKSMQSVSHHVGLVSQPN